MVYERTRLTVHGGHGDVAVGEKWFAFCDVLFVCILSASKVRKTYVNLPLAPSSLAQGF